jgi:hypothetical protein
VNIDFDPFKAFQAIDHDRNGSITAYEVYRFMKETLYQRISLSDAENLIKEFDSDQDGRINEQDFFNFLLPASSLSLRDIALKRGNCQSYSYKFLPLQPSTL